MLTLKSSKYLELDETIKKRIKKFENFHLEIVWIKAIKKSSPRQRGLRATPGSGHIPFCWSITVDEKYKK